MDMNHNIVKPFLYDAYTIPHFWITVHTYKKKPCNYSHCIGAPHPAYISSIYIISIIMNITCCTD